MENQKAFTIIELIVVIVIIAVLAGIILANVTQYNTKGKDTAIKGQISQIRTAAADFFYTNGTFIGMCGSGTACNNARFNIVNLGGSVGSNQQFSPSAYCMDFILNSGASWCVDNTGYTGPTDNCTSSHISCQ
jgi:prepilin-type N-terminal cleavage/methylation domain-containing protein